MAKKVLVVDDSALMRKHIGSLLKDAGFDVILARNGQEAVEMVLASNPDVVTLDINMPEMDGLTALSQIMTARPTPTVMVSSLTNKGALATLEALAMGAVDYVAKPGGTISLSIDTIADSLVAKVKAAATAQVKGLRSRTQVTAPPVQRKPALNRIPDARKHASNSFGLVLIGVSTGGPRTLEEILPLLPADFSWPVLVVQHMPASFTAPFAVRMNSLCRLHVKEAAAIEDIQPGTIYIARGGSDMAVSERAGRLIITSKPESSKYLWHPSVDVLVASALDHVSADRLIGVQLTGMGYDGAETMAELKRRGGRTIAESEDTAVIFGMPKELIGRGGATTILPSGKIASQIDRWLR
ncbi:chemotaxis-specific protein-glutamate methyltransferase CheB [Neorhizobium lilium]|uniref:Protein-glutamate methylesterase/protein-glutamine glutaminase n=1 Tax=Neorhizobium lilium TaxID=2503024 RepID=A0A444LKZ0_9HYPH|nr:chemotaxis-specific protein-glutamate methyltransferase CheB [Neorhizobium lilium]RWX81007.1 chemotaxis-specific protein-glutamate methyltransferase CheB [Neorhizobium lilium]